MNTSNLDIKILYLSCHNVLKKKFGINHPTPKKTIYAELGRHFLVPKDLRTIAIKELKEMGLIDYTNNNELVLLEYPIDIERDQNQIFQKFNLF